MGPETPQQFRTAAIVSTGTEILQGLYADTNAQYIAGRLCELGLDVRATVASPDDGDQLEAALRFAASRADVVVCSGGLGPTEDDVNRDVFARVFAAPLRTDADAVRMMEARFTRRGRPMPERNRVQALVPAGCTVFQNEWGTAPGYFLPSIAERGARAPADAPAHAALIALPGPPGELRPMFEACALPVLRARVAGEHFVRTLTVHTFGRPESELGELTRDLFRCDDRVVFTILAKTYGVDFRVTAHAAANGEMAELLERIAADVVARVGDDCVYGTDDDTMASATAALLRRHGRTVATAESCTGGLVAKMLTDLPGSSAYMVQGAVTYSNRAKETMLGVPHDLLERHGAVSPEVARAMAEGARAAAGTDYAVGITGVAGPDGGTAEKPVGLVHIALAHAGGTDARECRFLGGRDTVRRHAALTALDMIRRHLLHTAGPADGAAR